MQYPKSKDKTFDKNLFVNPTSEYRSEPFWAWNNKYDKDEYTRQMDNFKKMGFGGFFMHSRPGSQIEFMSQEYYDAMDYTIKYASDNGLFPGLYDDDRWPSGYGGGEVTRDHYEFRQKFMRFSKEINENDIPFCSYRLVFDEEGYLQSYSLGEDGEGELYYASIGTFQPTSWYGNSWYSDTLNKEAIDLFIKLSHDKYYDRYGKDFGDKIRSIFFDEPQFEKADKPFTGSNSEGLTPWTLGLEDIFEHDYGYTLFDRIPELFFTTRTKSKIQYDYYKLLLKLFATAFPDNIGKWCNEHNISSTGHYMCEHPIENQVRANAEAMRCYKGLSIPGVDMLIDLHEYITLKQASSVVHQYSKEGLMSEMYGVTGWQFDFAGHLHQGDWQAALGVTLRVHHLCWESMESEAKRDFPASISIQAPWHTRYSIIEDHFARVNTLMTRGKPIVKVGVIHPVESYWTLTGDRPHNDPRIAKLNKSIEKLTEDLLDANIDFDFISESLLDEQQTNIGETFDVCDMKYSTIILPEMITIRKTTLKKLFDFSKNGGKVYALSYPETVDVETEYPENLKKYINIISSDIISELGYEKIIDVTSNGKHKDGYIYNLRDDNGTLRLFMCPRSKPKRVESYKPENVTISIKGIFYPEYYDSFTGEIYPIAYVHKNGCTYIEKELYPLDSILVSLYTTPCGTPKELAKKPTYSNEICLDGEYSYSLSEPNVMLLDWCKIYIDEKFIKEDELFKCQTAINEFVKENGKNHKLKVEFNIDSRISTKADFALEALECATIFINDKIIDSKQIGTYIDKAEKKVHLGTLLNCNNKITVEYNMNGLRTLEPMYLLGEFGVFGEGRHFYIDSMPEKLKFGDITTQGFQFYGANISYEVITPECCSYSIKFPSIEGALAEVYEDEKLIGSAFIPPYVASNSGENKKHNLKIVFYGNRYNTLMPLHNADMITRWYGGHLFFQKGEKFTYDYLFRKTGFISSPIIEF